MDVLNNKLNKYINNKYINNIYINNIYNKYINIERKLNGNFKICI